MINNENQNKLDSKDESYYRSNYPVSQKQNRGKYTSLKEQRIHSFKNNAPIPLTKDEQDNINDNSGLKDEGIQCRMTKSFSQSNQSKNKTSENSNLIKGKLKSNKNIKKNKTTPNYIFVDGKLFKREGSDAENAYNTLMKFQNHGNESHSQK